ERFLQLMMYDERHHPIGFIEGSIRSDYVNGTETSPVGFVEGVYVAPPMRRQGVARRLYDAIGDWAKARGCRELASDALLDNESSQRAHRALGFQETERVVYFTKKL
ncbi:MAG TPA: aminoglycoside 6'-N-acetyltransferase, partial [Steroidobacteraceae bacterium]|nr:aminoglycoside 6'-N-acetyltransferase [Steroidobacteraceae bacterium]